MMSLADEPPQHNTTYRNKALDKSSLAKRTCTPPYGPNDFCTTKVLKGLLSKVSFLFMMGFGRGGGYKGGFW